jgi:hypothetical protein
VLYGDTNVIVAVNSFGGKNCVGGSYVYRVDTASAQAFLDDFVSLP